MTSTKRPYLIIPKLIQQPTWGGNYILNLKTFSNRSYLTNKKIGQSYELFGQSKLLLNVTNSSNHSFTPELGFPDKDETVVDNFSYQKNIDYISLFEFVKQDPSGFLGEKIFLRFGKMPLLIKFTQAIGNSFQLHIRPSENDLHWKPKAESWFYFEGGLLTYGVKKEIKIYRYKKVCNLIDKKIKQLGALILDRKIDLLSARSQAALFIKKLSPWQFVNLHAVKKNSLVDLSIGGIHHSWEEDIKTFPLGNVLYEIQQDVMDPISTIRSFDKGKFKDDGKIRELNIEDYFRFLDINPDNNEIDRAVCRQKGSRLLTTKNYSLDLLEIKNKQTHYTGESFCHLFVKDGGITVKSDYGEVIVGSGHSCFLPKNVTKYTIESNTEKSIILKAFIEI